MCYFKPLKCCCRPHQRQLCNAEAELSRAEDSCRSDFALALLQQLARQGHKALVFSQSRRMLDLLAAQIEQLGLSLLRIDGTLTAGERQARTQHLLLIILQGVLAFCASSGAHMCRQAAADALASLAAA